MPPNAFSKSLIRVLYAGFAWVTLLVCAVPVAIACLVVPGVARRRAVARLGASSVLKLIGIRIGLRGAPPQGLTAAIVAANHQSYLDGMILTAVLPPNHSFLIKSEMVRVPLAGFVLARLGSRFVDRSSADRRSSSARRLVQAARAGQALVVFPEGTCDAAPGLKAFRGGAFRAACLASVPVVPTVIRGSRARLPADSWLPRPGRVAVEFLEALDPAAFADDDALMRATRRAILQRVEEADLDPASTASPAVPPAVTDRRISDRCRRPAEPSEYSAPDP